MRALGDLVVLVSDVSDRLHALNTLITLPTASLATNEHIEHYVYKHCVTKFIVVETNMYDV